MKRKFKFIFLVPLALISIGIKAQQAVTTTGGNASGSGGSSSYTVGQVAYTTVSGSGGTKTLGVQQPFEILIVTGINNARGILLQSSVYPNPAVESITLKIDQYSLQDLSYQLYDMQGKILINSKVSNRETVIPMNDLSVASYLLNVVEKNNTIKTFKIIKNQ